MTGPIAASAEPPYSLAALFIMLMERLVRSWKISVGIPIFKISDIISFAKQHSLMLKLNTLFFRSM